MADFDGGGPACNHETAYDNKSRMADTDIGEILKYREGLKMHPPSPSCEGQSGPQTAFDPTI